jgi:hypothetical protein
LSAFGFRATHNADRSTGDAVYSPRGTRVVFRYDVGLIFAVAEGE